MRIANLLVTNFRAITALELTGLQETVVIAGPNGCGKSCVFDAIRLLKSAYGGYQANEWQSWFGEFQIKADERPGALLPLLQDRKRPLEATARVVLAPSEAEYLRAQAKELLTEQAWKEVIPDLYSWYHVGAASLAANRRAHQPEVDRRVNESLPLFLKELETTEHVAQIIITPDGRVGTAPSRVLEIVFSRYDAQHVGIVDYHGSTRNYGREQVGGINLNIDSTEEKLRKHALYGYMNKYSNIKTELATSYVRGLLTREAAPTTGDSRHSLTETLKELFATFFPGKAFLGPRPTHDGSLQFPVRTPNGAEHDIDELSAGEKEVLYGYLRLRNSAPQRSVILIDEPELHLNPRLIRGLAAFYHKHLGRALDNQLWLVTHSDTLIREAVGQRDFSVFHLQPPGLSNGPNQALPIKAGEDIERVVIDLVGDLAAYRPGAKIVVFEGGGNSEVDVRIACTLFPEFQSAVNTIAGGNKQRVTQLYDLLDAARRDGHLPATFYCITDADGERLEHKGRRSFAWDVYHIENYLLVPQFLLRVIQEIGAPGAASMSIDDVARMLRQSADNAVAEVVAHKLRIEADRALIGCIDLKFSPARKDVAVALDEAVVRSLDRISERRGSVLSRNDLMKRADALSQSAHEELADGRWRSTFPGRSVLSRFVGVTGAGVPYEAFRDLVVHRMRDANHRPEGMKKVIDAILGDVPVASRSASDAAVPTVTVTAPPYLASLSVPQRAIRDGRRR